MKILFITWIVNVHTYIYIYIYIYIHTHTHIHIITEMLNCKCMWIHVKLIMIKIIFVTCYFVILCKVLMELLMFIGPCIVIYSYSTTKKMHPFLKLFILVKRSTCFGQSFRPSSGAQDCTYSNRHMSKSCRYLHVAAAVWHTPVAVCAVLSSWWWTERLSEICRVFYKNK